MPTPPDDVHEWLTPSQVAAVLGMTRQGVGQRLVKGQLPYVVASGQRWVRRDLLRLVLAAQSEQVAEAARRAAAERAVPRGRSDAGKRRPSR